LDRDELFYEIGCTECHPFHFEDEELQAPDLTGYGSREWLISFISEPENSRFYGEQNDRMPSYRSEDILTEKEIGLIVDWLRMQ
jgi:ubiquinol-cytochrome c reductase cytochrome b subunit